MVVTGEIVKVRINYAEGSQTLSQCDPKAENRDLFAVAEAIASLKPEQDVEFIKITEAQLLGR